MSNLNCEAAGSPVARQMSMNSCVKPADLRLRATDHAVRALSLDGLQDPRADHREPRVPERVSVDAQIPMLVLTGEPGAFMLSVTEQGNATCILKRPVSAPDLAAEIRRATGLKA